MQEPYGEGPASHTGPESCVVGGNAQGEALTGEHAGQPLSSERGRHGDWRGLGQVYTFQFSLSACVMSAGCRGQAVCGPFGLVCGTCG